MSEEDIKLDFQYSNENLQIEETELNIKLTASWYGTTGLGEIEFSSTDLDVTSLVIASLDAKADLMPIVQQQISQRWLKRNIGGTFEGLLEMFDNFLVLTTQEALYIKQVYLRRVLPEIPVDTGKLRNSIVSNTFVFGAGDSYVISYDSPEDRPIEFILIRSKTMTVKEWLQMNAINIMSLYAHEKLSRLSIQISLAVSAKDELLASAGQKLEQSLDPVQGN
jgi:hypothetical protein